MLMRLCPCRHQMATTWMTRRDFVCPFPPGKCVIDDRNDLEDSRGADGRGGTRESVSRLVCSESLPNPGSFSLSQPVVPVSSIPPTFLHLGENVTMPIFDPSGLTTFMIISSPTRIPGTQHHHHQTTTNMDDGSESESK